MKMFLILLSFVFVSNLSYSQDTSEDGWIYVNSSDEKDLWYIRSEYLRKVNNVIAIWVKVENTDAKVKGVTYHKCTIRQYAIFDCELKRMAIKEYIIYNEKGKLLNNITFEQDLLEWKNIIPDTIGESVSDKVCELFN